MAKGGSLKSSFSKKASDLQALRDALVEAATVGVGLWVTYVFSLFYLFIAVGSVTDRELLLESPVKLPFLNVDLPLVGFFVLGPSVFLIVHMYVLLNFVMFGAKVGLFSRELQTQISDPEAQARLRRQLPSNTFVQFLAGPNEVRTGIMGVLLKLIAWISLVAAPLALLMFFQFQFLPYHSQAIAWLHRIIVMADLALLWIFWPSIVGGTKTRIGLRDFRRPTVMAATIASILPIWLILGVAIFPGEWLADRMWSLSLAPQEEIPTSERRLRKLSDMLVSGRVDLVARKATSIWSYQLVLPNFDPIDHAKFDSEEKIANLPVSVSLHDRSLEGIVLVRAQLRKANFTAARLQNANLDYADLREARFECGETGEMTIKGRTRNLEAKPATRCTQIQGGSFQYAQLQQATFHGADLRNANLKNGRLERATLSTADLRGADLTGAHLENASLVGASLDGAKLNQAFLNSANFQGAKLERVCFLRADLRAASLEHAELNGASFAYANLYGANLASARATRADFNRSQLENAVLRGANLDGANLKEADLAGADLRGASLAGANLEGANLEYADLRGANLEGANLAKAKLAGVLGAKLGKPAKGGQNAVSEAMSTLEGSTPCESH